MTRAEILARRLLWKVFRARPKDHDSAGGLLYNAEGLIREVLLRHAEHLPKASVDELYRIWKELQRMEYSK